MVVEKSQLKYNQNTKRVLKTEKKKKLIMRKIIDYEKKNKHMK